MSPRPVGSVVTLTNHRPGSWANGPHTGDVLETTTGRRYLITDRKPVGRDRASYTAIVMDPADDYPPESVRFSWAWAKR